MVFSMSSLKIIVDKYELFLASVYRVNFSVQFSIVRVNLILVWFGFTQYGGGNFDFS